MNRRSWTVAPLVALALAPGRFISAHLQDYAPSDHTKEVIMGTGIVDWKDFFDAAKVGGLQYIFVEMETDPTIMKGCADYIKSL